MKSLSAAALEALIAIAIDTVSITQKKTPHSMWHLHLNTIFYIKKKQFMIFLAQKCLYKTFFRTLSRHV